MHTPVIRSHVRFMVPFTTISYIQGSPFVWRTLLDYALKACHPRTNHVNRFSRVVSGTFALQSPSLYPLPLKNSFFALLSPPFSSYNSLSCAPPACFVTSLSYLPVLGNHYCLCFDAYKLNYKCCKEQGVLVTPTLFPIGK